MVPARRALRAADSHLEEEEEGSEREDEVEDAVDDEDGEPRLREGPRRVRLWPSLRSGIDRAREGCTLRLW